MLETHLNTVWSLHNGVSRADTAQGDYLACVAGVWGRVYLSSCSAFPAKELLTTQQSEPCSLRKGDAKPVSLRPA